MRLKRNFFNRDTVVVAQELLGQYLIRKIDGKIMKARITETEAYCGPDDLACHASKGLTPRTKVMFGPPGHAYIYLIYGMYHCLNIVTEEEGYPAAVLIRSVHLCEDRTLTNGPGKLCRELKIDKSSNAIDICKSEELWLEEGEKIAKNKIKKSKRIGVDYAGEWKDKPWRFSL
jgi:DNA-3-methyladenine glycosylase